MPHFAPALSTKVLDLTCGVRREVIVMHVPLVLDGAEVIQLLCFSQRAKSRERNDLSVTTGEEACAMRARRDAHFAPDRADFRRRSSIRALALTQDSFAHDVLFSLVKGFSDGSH